MSITANNVSNLSSSRVKMNFKCYEPEHDRLLSLAVDTENTVVDRDFFLITHRTSDPRRKTIGFIRELRKQLQSRLLPRIEMLC